MTRLDLICGFLGAGKTTFLRRYAARLIERGERVAIIENEFGAAGVDTAFLREDGLEVSQLTGGCICCGQKVNFHDLVLELAAQGGRILVEPSGIFNMDDFWDVADSPAVRAACEIGAAIMVCDPTQEDIFSGELRDIAVSQLLGAGAIVLSKVQCLPAAQTEAYADRLRELAMQSGRDIGGILWREPWESLSPARLDVLAEAGAHRTPHARTLADHSALFGSVTLWPDVVSPEALREAARALQSGRYGRVLRVKGVVRTRQGCFSVNCTPGFVQIEPAQPQESMLNIIGERLLRREIRALFRASEPTDRA